MKNYTYILIMILLGFAQSIQSMNKAQPKNSSLGNFNDQSPDGDDKQGPDNNLVEKIGLARSRCKCISGEGDSVVITMEGREVRSISLCAWICKRLGFLGNQRRIN